MRYGYSLRTVFTYQEIRDLAIRVEDMGFESVHVNDHLIGFDEKKEKKELYLESMLLMAALARETKKIMLGHIVLCNSFRNPALLAKMISTLDNISEGRALLWIGAGWYEEEYKSYGYVFPSAKERVDRLEEALIIFKKLFTEDNTYFEGKFWKLENCRNFPKPLQKPYPQIVVGTDGKRMIKIAAREADGVNLPYPTIKKLPEKIKYINEQLQRYNRDPEEFEISIFNAIKLVDSEEELEDVVTKIQKRQKDKKQTKEKIIANNYIGFPEDIKEKIIETEDAGVKKMVISVRKSRSIEDPLALFKEKVM